MYQHPPADPSGYQRPWAPPHPGPVGAAGWPTYFAPGPPPAPTPPPPHTPSRPPGGGRRRAVGILGIVVGALALLVGAGYALFVLAGTISDFALEEPADGSGGIAPLTGTLPARPANQALPAAVLVDSVTEVITDDGWSVDVLDCPSTPEVAQGVVTLCHGTLDGGQWSVIVFFEDTRGKFTLLLN